MSRTEDEYKALLNSYVSSVAKGDPKATAGHYTENAVLLLPGISALHGREQIEANYAAMLGDGLDLDVRITEIQDFGDTVCGTGTTVGAGMNGKWLEVLRRNEYGDLRIHRLAFNET